MHPTPKFQQQALTQFCYEPGCKDAVRSAMLGNWKTTVGAPAVDLLCHKGDGAGPTIADLEGVTRAFRMVADIGKPGGGGKGGKGGKSRKNSDNGEGGDEEGGRPAGAAAEGDSCWCRRCGCTIPAEVQEFQLMGLPLLGYTAPQPVCGPCHSGCPPL